MKRNRLTIHNADGTYAVPGIDVNELDDRVLRCISRLGEYEDTKLTPMDIEALKLPEARNDITDILSF